MATYLAYTFVASLLALVIYPLMFYINYSLRIHKFIFKFPVDIGSFMCIVLYWILLTPTIEAYSIIFICKDNAHVIMQTLECWSTIHIVYCVAFTICGAFFITLIYLIAMMFNECKENNVDAMGRMD